MSSFVKNGLTLIGLIIVGGLGYYLFVIRSDFDVSLNTGGGIDQAKLASEQFLRELNAIKTLELPSELFVDQRFRSFVDFTQPVPEQAVGRPNPFAPVE